MTDTLQISSEPAPKLYRLRPDFSAITAPVLAELLFTKFVFASGVTVQLIDFAVDDEALAQLSPEARRLFVRD